MAKSILIVGGTSGLGLDLARRYLEMGHRVAVTGRRDPGLTGALWLELGITADAARLGADLDRVLAGAVAGQGEVNTLVYNAGFLQRGRIDTLDDAGLQQMSNVGLLAPMLLAARLKRAASAPPKLILVTSSSHYTPREYEPAYAATKAGLAMLGASLARDAGIGKVCVIAPSGIRTPFWDGTGEDVSTMLDPGWVADQIVALTAGPFKYRYAKLLRNPARAEIVETLDAGMRPV